MSTEEILMNINDANLAEYLFHEGTNYCSQDYLGAHLSDDGKCTFRVWAPNASQVFVTGSFCDWEDFTHEAYRITAGGIYECIIDGVQEFDSYKFVIKTQEGKILHKADPYAFHSETRPGTASKVYNIDGYNWSDDKWMKERSGNDFSKAVNIYELHFGSWRRYDTGECFNYEKMAEELIPYVKEMGYTHIELMPMSEYPYDKSWGYQVTGYFAPTSRYGTPKEFMQFVDRCHTAGIGVLLDWVPAHFPKDAHGLARFDGTPLFESGDPLKNENPRWGTHYFDWGRTEVRSFLLSSAVFWAEKYHVDGLRVDAVTSMLYLDYDRAGLPSSRNAFGGNENLDAIAFLRQLNTTLHELFPSFLTVAEESTAFPGVTAPASEGGLGFDFKWNMGWANDIFLYLSHDPLYRGAIHDKLTFSMLYSFSEKFILPVSHDEVTHGKGSLWNKMSGNEESKFATLRAFFAFMYAHPGKKLLFMGSEFGQKREWDCKSSVDLFLANEDGHASLLRYVSSLNRFYLSHPPLWENDTDWEGFHWLSVDDWERNAIAFERISRKGEKVLCVFNFSGQTQQGFSFPVSDDRFRVLFTSSYGVRYGEDIDGEDIVSKQGASLSLDLPPCSALFLSPYDDAIDI